MDKTKGILETDGFRCCKCGELTKRMPGHHIRSETIDALRQDDGVQEYGRLCYAGCFEVFRSTFEHYVGNPESKDFVCGFQEFLTLAAGLVEVLGHSGIL